jgi:hypothetical protein
MRVLSAEYHLEALSEEGVDQGLAREISSNALRRRTKRDEPAEELALAYQRRCDVDGRLVALLVHRRQAYRNTGKFAAIVSTSATLRHICDQLTDRLGYQSGVISPARLAFALALLPSACLNLQTLRMVLFGTEFAKQMSGSFELAERVFKAQGRPTHEFAGRIQLGEIVDGMIAGPD